VTELRGTPGERALAGSDEGAAALHELPNALILVFDEDLRFVLSAGKALERLGEPPSCRPGEPLAGAFPGEVWSALEPLLRSALAGETRSREISALDGERCLMIETGPVGLPASPAGEVRAAARLGGIAVVFDVTARRWVDALARRSEGDFAEVFERAPIGTGLLDLDGRWLLVNRALCEITGYTVDELLHKRFDGIVHPEDAYNDKEQRAQLLAGEIPAYQVEKRYFDAAGETVSAIVSVSLVRDGEGRPVHYIIQLQDISERKELEEHLRHLADHDPLTGLRNRRLFMQDLRLQVARSRRYGETAALLVIDLDDFKSVNDTHGHTVGDEVLRSVARALTRRLRETDLVARLGGDEFAVILPHIEAEGANVVARGLARVIPARGIDVGEQVLHPLASVGVALIDGGCESAEQALSQADLAMYEVKRSGSTQPA